MSNKNSNFPNAKKPDCTPEEISTSLRGFDKIMELPPCTKNNPEEIKQRITEMFRYCETEGRKPTVELLTAFLGVTRAALWQWQQDQNSEAGRLINKAKNLINVLITEWSMTGQIPFQYGIWQQKNWYEYKDSFEISAISSQSRLEELPSKEQIIKRLPELADGETEPDVEGII